MKGVEKTVDGTFRARIRIGGKLVSLGVFVSERDAAEAYKEAKNRVASGHPPTGPEWGPLGERDSLMAKYRYTPDSGHFYYRGGRGVAAGRLAGGIAGHGYWTLTCGSRRYQAHRVAWLFVHGYWPQNDIDHINGVKHDNRIANLREATRSQNLANTRSRSSTGLKGVCVRTNPGNRKKIYFSRIRVRGKLTRLGDFSTPEEAHAAYVKAAVDNFGEFARVK